MNAQHELREFESLADACRALSHPARLAILETLARCDSCVCGEIVKVMPLSQATVSQHLKVLREAGLISGRVEGPKSCYCLDREALGALRADLERMFGALDNCC